MHPHLTAGLKIAAAFALLPTLYACPPPEEPLTGAEAREATEQIIWAGQASALTADSVEITTDFTLGEGAKAAAESLADFYRSQVPCSTVSLDDQTVTVDYGALDDRCSWRGRTWAGVHSVRFDVVEEGGVEVLHTWTGFTQGTVSVTGTAQVTWTGTDPDSARRTVVHDLEWTSGDRRMIGEGARTQRLLDPSAGLAGGIRVDGVRAWLLGMDGPRWRLEIDGVEIRPQDPVPQAGTWTLITDRHTLSVGFARKDERAIEVTLQHESREFRFTVRSSGAFSEG